MSLELKLNILFSIPVFYFAIKALIYIVKRLAQMEAEEKEAMKVTTGYRANRPGERLPPVWYVKEERTSDK